MQPNSVVTKMRDQQFESWGKKKGKGEKGGEHVNQKHKRWAIRIDVVVDDSLWPDTEKLALQSNSGSVEDKKTYT